MSDDKDAEDLLTIKIGLALALSVVAGVVAWAKTGVASGAQWLVSKGVLAPAQDGIIPVTSYASLDLPRVLIIAALILVVLTLLWMRVRSRRQE